MDAYWDVLLNKLIVCFDKNRSSREKRKLGKLGGIKLMSRRTLKDNQAVDR